MAQILRDHRMEQKANEKGADVMALNNLHMIGNLEDNYFLEQPQHSDQLQFFKQSTGIQDSRRLREHIISIAKQAYEVFPYPCIWGNLFHSFFFFFFFYFPFLKIAFI